MTNFSMTCSKANYANFVSFFWAVYDISNDRIFLIFPSFFLFFYPISTISRLISF